MRQQLPSQVLQTAIASTLTLPPKATPPSYHLPCESEIACSVPPFPLISKASLSCASLFVATSWFASAWQGSKAPNKSLDEIVLLAVHKVAQAEGPCQGAMATLCLRMHGGKRPWMQMQKQPSAAFKVLPFGFGCTAEMCSNQT